MKAAILVAQHEPLVVDEVQLPDELTHGQVLVRVDYSGICGSQLGEIDGVKGPDRHLPHLLGHEGSGWVMEVGPGVKLVRPGDHVVMHWMKGKGIEADPPRYTWQGRPLNAGWITTFNELAIVSENRLTPIPAGLDGRVAALFGCAVTTGLGAVTNNAKVRMGESVVVLGAGGVGLNMIQGASLTSAHPILAVDVHENRLELARTMGATHALNGRAADLQAEIPRLLGGRGADVVIDNTGLPEMIELAYELTHPQGRVILVGVPRAGAAARLHTLPLHFGKVLTGSHGGETNPSEDIPRYLRLLEAGRLALAPLLTNELPLAAVNEALARIRSGDVAGRCLLNLARAQIP
jgi:S-(hydroxymethyl)glutathione dehydrogenase/alcohol dehydrogenase